MAGTDAVNPVALLRVLGVTDVTSILPVSGGWDTTIWRVDTPGDSYALRLFRPEQVETCQREVVAMEAARAAGIPIPMIRAQGTWRDRPMLLLAWCQGEPLLHVLRSQPWRAWTLSIEMGSLLARIHSIAPPPRLAKDPMSWLAMAGRDETRLRQRLHDAPGGRISLWHGDYHLLNLMSDGRHITGVLDWANARAGDPRADVARVLAILRLAPLPAGTPRTLAFLMRGVVEAGFRRGYVRVAGREAFADLPLFLAWAGAHMYNDLAPKVGRPGVWLIQADLQRIRCATESWKRRAGM